MTKLTIREITKELKTLKSKGYVKVGFKAPLGVSLNILLIHKDWKEYNFVRQFDQANADLPPALRNAFLVSFEIPTMDMYLNDRLPHAPRMNMVIK